MSLSRISQGALRPQALSRLSLLLLVGSLWACGGVKPIPYIPMEASETEASHEKVREAWEKMMSAEGAGELLRVDSWLKSSCERCAARLELDALRAQLLSDPIKEVVKLIGAMSDPDNPHPSYTLWRIKQAQGWLHRKHSEELLGLLLGMSASHPKLDARRVAAFGAAELALGLGDDGARAQALSRLGEPLKMWVIGPYSNQHGRGYHTPYAPERSWSSALKNDNQSGWRDELPRDSLGYYHLSESLYEQSRHVGYAAQSLRFAEAGELSLRVNSSAPLKVWWNGRLLFESERAQSELFDVITLPIQAVKGTNRLLIKLAELDVSRLRVDLLNADGGRLESGRFELGSFDDELSAEAQAAPTKRVSAQGLIDRVLGLGSEEAKALKELSGYELYLRAEVARSAGFKKEQDQALEALLERSPKSLLTRFELAKLALSRGEQGEGELALSKLAKKDGKRLPLLTLSYGESLRMRGAAHAYFNAIRGIISRYNESMPVLSAWLSALAERAEFGRMKNTIDYLKRVNPDAPFTLQLLAEYELGLKDMGAALSAAYRWKELYPGELKSWFLIAKLEDRRADMGAQIKLWSEMIERAPHLKLGYMRLAAAYAVAGEISALEELLERWGAQHPTDPNRFKFKAMLLDRRMVKDRLSWDEVEPQLKEAWSSAFKLYQKDRLIMSQRYSYEKERELFWSLRVPNDDKIKALVSELPKLTSQATDTDLELVKDLTIFRVYRSGPTEMRHLRVIRALSESGVNRLRAIQVNKLGIPSGTFYLKKNRAYSLSPSGERLNPTSQRRNVIRFGQLEVGSVVVVDVSYSRLGQRYFSDQFSYDRHFQGYGSSLQSGEFELWLEEGAPEPLIRTQGEVTELSAEELKRIEDEVSEAFKEQTEKRLKRFKRAQKRSKLSKSKQADNVKNFEDKREEAKRGLIKLTEGWKRRRWRAGPLKALKREAWAPKLEQRSALISLSTLDSWADLARWERSFLYNKFSLTPKLKEKLSELLKGAEGETERLERIARYVAAEIQYEQDYESSIAGVEPHSAQLVSRRGYGDCKDQAVLFTALAREAGLKSEVAILKTNSAQTRVATPSAARFNHMIAYTPAQGDLKEARFFDPTASKLDVSVIPVADQGADAMVIYSDARGLGEGEEYEWVKVPVEPLERNRSELSFELELSQSGELKGSLSALGQGLYSAQIRAAQSPKQRKAMMKDFAQRLYYDVELGETEPSPRALTKPAISKAQVTYLGFDRNGGVLSLPLPRVRPMRQFFSDKEREQPLRRLSRWASRINARVKLPKGAKVLKSPQSLKLDTRCVMMSVESTVEAGELRVDFSYEQRCHEMELEQYQSAAAELQSLYRKLANAQFKIKL